MPGEITDERACVHAGAQSALPAYLSPEATPSGLDGAWFDDVEDFLDRYSDAEIIDGTTHPNAAMRLLCQLREAR